MAAGAADRPVPPEALAVGLHEWLAPEEGGRAWLPPETVLADLAWRAILNDGDPAPESLTGDRVAWIGRRCWPYPPSLVRRDPTGDGDHRLLERSIFVDPRTRDELVWAADLALRCPGIAAVVADGSGLQMPASRRLRLAAVAGGTLGLLARPDRERRSLSTAHARWAIAPWRAPRGAGCGTMGAADVGGGVDPADQAWMVELLRCKGVQPSIGSARRWVVRREHATGVVGGWQACDVGVARAVVDRSPPAEAAKIA